MATKNLARNSLTALFLLALPLGCQSTEGYQDRSADIKALEEEKAAVIKEQTDLLAPEEYEKMSASLSKAKDLAADRKDPSEQVDKSQAYMADIHTKAEPSKSMMKDVLAARQMAADAEADKLYSDEFKSVDNDVRAATKRAASGNVRVVQNEKEELRQKYLNLQNKSIVEKNLGEAKQKLKTLEDNDADDFAPITFKQTENKLKDAELSIRADALNKQTIAAAVSTSTMEVARLEKIAEDSKRLKSEKSAIELYEQEYASTAERNRLNQENEILNAKLSEANAKNAEQQEAQNLEDLYTAAQQQFSKSEADVYKDGNNILIRLKGLNFSKGKSTLPESPVLAKLETVIQEFDSPEVKVEGHTDSTGTATINSKLSQQRAEALKNYLVSRNSVDAQSIVAQGYGEEKPIASNKSAGGRALNRRVDVVIIPR